MWSQWQSSSAVSSPCDCRCPRARTAGSWEMESGDCPASCPFWRLEWEYRDGWRMQVHRRGHSERTPNKPHGDPLQLRANYQGCQFRVLIVVRRSWGLLFIANCRVPILYHPNDFRELLVTSGSTPVLMSLLVSTTAWTLSSTRGCSAPSVWAM